MQYRREIDGLRAVALIPVILFHAGFEIFSGGYVGVDVFFVISGYLITSIIISELEAGQFSITGFYERRARRILPALFFVIACCLPFAWFMMVPSQLKDFAQSLVAVSLFSSNILFWIEIDYFAPAAELKPLLHTWSLAVEEQYYIFFPPFLILAWRFGRSRAFWAIVIIAILSLLLSEWMSARQPSANFYLAPTRAWELLAGSLCAFLGVRMPQRSNNILSGIGIALIGYSMVFFDSHTPFPGLYAVVPVAGTVLIVLFATTGTIVARLLSMRVLVGIGLISYSAYLWHQPLFAFARIGALGEPPQWQMMSLAILSLLLAIASWQFVEQPFRLKRTPWLSGKRAVFGASVAGGAVFLTLGIVVTLMNGVDSRLTPQQRAVLAFETNTDTGLYREGACLLDPAQGGNEFDPACAEGKPRLILGDSHAAALWAGFGPSSEYGQLTASACPTVFDFDAPGRPRCRGVNDYVRDTIASRELEEIIIHAAWTGYFHTPDFADKLTRTIDEIKRQSGSSRLIIVGNVPDWSPTLPRTLVGHRQYLTHLQRTANDTSDHRFIDATLKEIAKTQNIEFISALDMVCEKQECISVIPDNGGFAPVAWDDSHLTEAGAAHLASLLRQSLAVTGR